MRKSGFVTQAQFDSHLNKHWQTVHQIWPNIRGVTVKHGARGSVGAHAASHEVGGGDLLAFVDIAGFGDYLDQGVRQADSPLFANLNFGANPLIRQSAGVLTFQTDEGVNTNTVVDIKGKGTGYGSLRIYDQDNAEWLEFLTFGEVGILRLRGTSPSYFALQYDQRQDIKCWSAIGGGNPYLYLYGWDAGAGTKKWLRARVEADGDALIEAEHNLNILAGGGEISFGNENLTTTGTLSAANITDTGVEATNMAGGTTGQRPGGIVGDIRYNSTLGGFEVYTGAWKNMILSGDSPIFGTVKLSDLTDGYVPYHVDDATGLANSPIINFGGNIGINVADPDEKLEVNGNIKADTFLLAAGVTPNLGWLSDVNLGSLEEGETIRYDQATAKFVDAWGIDYDNPRLVYKIKTDFTSAGASSNDPWIGASIAGGPAATALAGTDDHPGIIRFQSAAALNSGYRFLTAVNCIRIAGAEHSEFCFRTAPVMLNTRVRLGFQDSLTSALPTDGVYIDITGTTLSGKTYNNGAGSTTGTTYNCANSTWYRGKIAVNNDATEVVFILYSAAGVVLWTDSLAANIPTAAGRETGHGIVAWVGIANARTLVDVDMMIATRAGFITR